MASSKCDESGPSAVREEPGWKVPPERDLQHSSRALIQRDGAKGIVESSLRSAFATESNGHRKALTRPEESVLCVAM